jgi:hypothetical protein
MARNVNVTLFHSHVLAHIVNLHRVVYRYVKMSEDGYSRVFRKNAKTEKGQVFGRSF